MGEEVDIAAGQSWRLPCPFFREEHDGHDGALQRWRPGKYETHYGETSDGKGYELRDVVAVINLPKPHQARVFFKRSWIAPDGHTFGNNRLLCIALPAFKAWRRMGPSWNRQWGSGGAKLAGDTNG